MSNNEFSFIASKTAKKKPKKKFGNNPNYKSNNQANNPSKRKENSPDGEQSRNRSENRSENKPSANGKNKTKKHGNTEWAKKSQNKPQSNAPDSAKSNRPKRRPDSRRPKPQHVQEQRPQHQEQTQYEAPIEIVAEEVSEESGGAKPVFNVSEPIQMALDEMGFKHPSPIQAQAIPVLMKGKDLIGQAQTGTGKTAAFAIPILEQVEATKREQINTIQALVLCPTRELCLQLAGEFRKLGQFMPDVAVVSVYGGKPIDRQIKMLKKKPQIVIGTPGRTLDLIRRGNLKLHAVNTAVLDEADEMLNMGFRPDIEAILRATPKSRQTVFFSATMPQAIVDLAGKFQHGAQLIKVAKHDQPLVKIEQCYFEVPKSRKMMALEQLLRHHSFGLAVVFCKRKWKVDSLVKKLKTQGYKADGLHGGKTQSQRDRIMQGFRKGKCTLLVATDVAARGLDVDDVEAVINYDMPNDNEFYVHRIGRTGRAGKSGQAFTFVDEDERRQLKALCKFANVEMQRKELPA